MAREYKKPSERKSRHDDDFKSWVYVTLQGNSGNVYKTAKETGVHEATLRTWVKKWQNEGVPEVILDKIPDIVEAEVDQWSSVRNKALQKLLSLIPQATERQLSALANIAGMAEDKVRMIQGLPTNRTETVQRNLPNAEDVNKFIDGLVNAQKKRTEEIDSSEVEIIRVEQPKGLPEGE